MTRHCQCCANIRRANEGNQGPAAARWTGQNGHVTEVCESCLTHWFDNADDDPDLEPAAWSWIAEAAEPRKWEFPMAEMRVKDVPERLAGRAANGL